MILKGTKNLLVWTIRIHAARCGARGQANKSARGMPWHQEPKKDVTSCDKLRGAANRPRSVDFRMGQPSWSNVQLSVTESIGNRGETQGSETSQYLKEKKSTEIPQVVASERGRG